MYIVSYVTILNWSCFFMALEGKQTNFKCRNDLLKRLKYQAVKEERNQAEILNQALEEYLDRNEDGKQTKLTE